MPGLRSFSISCGIAIGAIFVLQTSWFVACLTLDQRRIDGRRNGFAPCIVYGKKREGARRPSCAAACNLRKIMERTAQLLRSG